MQIYIQIFTIPKVVSYHWLITGYCVYNVLNYFMIVQLMKSLLLIQKGSEAGTEHLGTTDMMVQNEY